MKPLYKFLFISLIVLLLCSVGWIVKLEFQKSEKEENISSLVADQGQNKIIEKYIKDSVTHTIYEDRIINDSKSEKVLALGKTYADSLQKALKISIDKIDQFTKINAKLEAKVLLSNTETPAGQKVKVHKDKDLDLVYFPETDSLKMAYNISLNEARYSEKKWFLGSKQNYINLFSDDKRVSVNGLKSYRIKESPPNRFGLGLQAGYGLGKDGNVIRLVPYIGLGLNYNLLEF